MRRHRLIEGFLVKTLNLAWDEVHEEAEHMEHAVSDRLMDRIDAFLGHPDSRSARRSDSAPRRLGGQHSEVRSLAVCQAGDRFRLARVVDQSPEFLRYLASSGLVLGANGAVIANQPAASIVTVEIDGRQTTLGRQAAEKILVSILNADSLTAAPVGRFAAE